MPNEKYRPLRQSKAQLTVGMMSHNRTICDQITALRDDAETLLHSEHPTKRQRKELLATAEALLSLQSTVEEQIPELAPKECTKYSINRIHADIKHNEKTLSDVCPPRENLRIRTFSIGEREYPLPFNKLQFSAVEACSILKQVEESKVISMKKAIHAMIRYSPSTSESIRSLIPCGYSTMAAMYTKFKVNPSIAWAKV